MLEYLNKPRINNNFFGYSVKYFRYLSKFGQIYMALSNFIECVVKKRVKTVKFYEDTVFPLSKWFRLGVDNKLVMPIKDGVIKEVRRWYKITM